MSFVSDTGFRGNTITDNDQLAKEPRNQELSTIHIYKLLLQISLFIPYSRSWDNLSKDQNHFFW